MRDARTPAELADQLIALVRGVDVGGVRADTAAAVMFSAYKTANRRLAAIVSLARDGYGTEAMILVRSLLSLLARAAYVDLPTDVAAREARYARSHALRARHRDRGAPLRRRHVVLRRTRDDSG